MWARRAAIMAGMPLHPDDPQELQYQLPNPEVARFVIPSYASHVVLENTPDKATAAYTTVKMYRVEHRTMPVDEFINASKRPNAITSPYHPTTYRPFFLGEFDARGNLLNSQEPMLYWLVPILPRLGGVPPGETNKRPFLDYMSYHALADVLPNASVDDLGDPKFKEQRFDWDQLR
jgi:hypothetical protein